MNEQQLKQQYAAEVQGVWYPPHWEPNPALDAWITIHTDGDSYETVKYGGYNADGEMTWAKNSRTIRRWMYLPDEGYQPKKGARQLSLFE